ncbi:MAG TPA: DUF2459 domain-containing protein [Tepidisphaeraceae bacterium]|jgi:hypothetical protein|nr:DUF2459 domain-containing protein [Tepidisphaeraceae bacterium]
MLRQRISLLVLSMFALVGGCATRILPPANPANPVAVYVTDYGRHSSLLLPMGDGHLMEYSYGDWEFYALNKYKWYIGATKLIMSDASGLGRRILPHPGNDEALQKMINSKRLLRIEIEQSRVMELLAELDQRYCSKIETMVFNDYGHAYFVKDDSHYSLFHTCNGQTAQWLRKLGCEVDGLAVISNFEVVRPKIEQPRLKKEEEIEYARNGERQPPGQEPVQLSQQQAQKRPSSTQQFSLRQR